MKISGKFVRMRAAAFIFVFVFALFAPLLGAATAKAANICHITASAAAGGSISDAGTSNIPEGTDKTYSINPDKGHVVNYVTVNGESIGAVTEYTFKNVYGNHEIRAYFITETAYLASISKNLSVVGSYAVKNGSGKYKPNAKVTIDAGIMPGFTFAGWLASNGKIYPSAQSVITMPNYDLTVYAHWMLDGAPGGLFQIVAANLKDGPIYGWQAIVQKLVTFTPQDTLDGKDADLKVKVTSYNCYADPLAVAILNARQGIALTIEYGADASFTFLSDNDNSLFTGTDFSYTSSTLSVGIMHEKKIAFAEQGAIKTSVLANIYLPEALPGQPAYVYITDASGKDALYMSPIVDEKNRVVVPLAAKVNLKVLY